VARARNRFEWEGWPDEELLDLRLCDLGVRLEGTWLEEPIERLRRELAARDLRVRPHVWVSEEWFSPEGVPGIAIPFFLTHPRLVKLERKHMLEVEGGTRTECMKLLRHEAGHAIHHAFDLHRRRRWQRHFGKSSTRYPERYRPNPASRRFVVHLDYWYAQSHPDEDFAESFAVWMTPGSRWRQRYAEWPALKKLEYVDTLMGELAGRRPPVRTRRQVAPISRIRTTLREYYSAKREHYQWLASNIYDSDLYRLFAGPDARSGESASAFLRRNRAEIRHMVAKGTGKHELAIDAVLDEMITRCWQLRLRAVGSKSRLLVDFAILLAARSVEYVYRGRDWLAV
jgi:hypothetical protein